MFRSFKPLWVAGNTYVEMFGGNLNNNSCVEGCFSSSTNLKYATNFSVFIPPPPPKPKILEPIEFLCMCVCVCVCFPEYCSMIKQFIHSNTTHI